jgi:hypothetical protein
VRAGRSVVSKERKTSEVPQPTAWKVAAPAADAHRKCLQSRIAESPSGPP